MGLMDILRVIPGVGLMETMLDVARDGVHPIRGSILYCDLFGIAEHSGVYIGNNQIVHLEKSGYVRTSHPFDFVDGTSSVIIRVSAKGASPVGSEDVARRAESMVGTKRRYNVLTNNCHRFASGCLTGSFNNSRTLLSLLKADAAERIGAKDWRVWDISEADFYGYKAE